MNPFNCGHAARVFRKNHAFPNSFTRTCFNGCTMLSFNTDAGTAHWLNRASWLLRFAIAAVSIFVILLFLYTALRRLHYPYELEQLEGSMFIAALRVFHGQSVYPRPSLDFIPYMYSPGYYYAAAALGKIYGMTIATLRLTSILSTLGCFAAIYALVWTEVRRHLPALAAAGLYAGCYTLCQLWFDLGRLDSFFVLLVLLAMLCTRRLHPVIAAVAWALAFQTKQSILPAAFLMLLSLWEPGNAKRIRRALAGVITFAVLAFGSVAWLNHRTAGWYSFYVFRVPSANADIKLRALFVFWPDDMLRPLALALVLIAAAALLAPPSLRSRATRFYLAALSLIPLFWWIRAHSGSTVNSLMPVYALLAVLFGIAIARLMQALPQSSAQPALLLLLLAVFTQETAGIYNPGDYLPPPETTTSLHAVVDEVHALPGDVYVAQHPFYAYLAGKPTYADLVSLHDAMRPKSPIHNELSNEMQQAMATQRFSSIVLDEPAAAGLIDTVDGGDTAWRNSFPTQENIPRTTPTQTTPTLSPHWLMTR